MLSSDLLLRRQTHFTLWRPHLGGNAPVLVIGRFVAGNPNFLAEGTEIPLPAAADAPGLWMIAAGDTGLADGIYHYWFRVENTNPGRPAFRFCAPIRWLPRSIGGYSRPPCLRASLTIPTASQPP